MKVNVFIKRVVFAAACLLAIAVFVSGGISLLVVKEIITETSAVILTQILVSALVCMTCCYHSVKAGKNRMQISLGIGALYLGMSLATGLLITPKSELKIDGWMDIVILMAAVAGVISGTKRGRRR